MYGALCQMAHNAHKTDLDSVKTLYILTYTKLEQNSAWESSIVCLFVLITGYSLLRAPTREWIFACTAVCTPASRAVVLRLQGDLTCMLRICLYKTESIKGERRGVGNVSFR